MATSLLATDGYKFSMAEAGWPLRKETFYYTHRKGGLPIRSGSNASLSRRWSRRLECSQDRKSVGRERV